MPASPPKLQLDKYLPYLVNRVGTAMADHFTATTLERHQLSIMMWRGLVVLSNNGAGRLIDVSRLTSIDPSTLSRMVARLSRLGLVSRQRSKTSDREVLIALTPQGRKILARLVPIGRQYEDKLVRGIAASDLAVTERVLKRMYENLPAVRQRDAASV
jgi:MarR family transcriptional regulator, organic hydroperoxide resistance regulator